MSYTKEDVWKYHAEPRPGKVEVLPSKRGETQDDLTLAYSPGVADACRAIEADPAAAASLTARSNLVAVVSNGTAVLGLGNIGPLAGKPVMEGKGMLFKMFADVDVFDLELATTDPDELINVVKTLEPTFGGINLEDISAPRCFEIERRLRKELDIPVFHDDQHGTAIVVCAGILNALRLVKKELSTARFVINGAGSAGISIATLLLELGARDIIMVDRAGILCEGEEWMNPAQKQMAEKTNQEHLRGSLADAMKQRDIFIGVSAPNIVSAEMVATMNSDAIVFAMANPTPEILPQEAKKGGARVVATGRSDFPNQINNVLVFPGIFRGALDARADDITEEMKLAAARAIAAIVTDEELCEDYIIPDAFNKQVVQAVARAVMEAARR